MHIGLYAGSEHAPVYTDAQLQRGTPAIYMMLLISYFSTFNLQTATRILPQPSDLSWANAHRSLTFCTRWC